VTEAIYRPIAPAALLASAFGASFPVYTATAAPYELIANGKAAVVRVRGPLCYASAEFENYAGITARVEAALLSRAQTIVMHIGSPGGDVAGCFDTARGIRARVAASGKKLIAYCDDVMASSAYALGCAADEIIISDTATIGSIGVIATAIEVSRQDKAMGVNVNLVTSGARKADRNVHAEFTDDMRGAMQVAVDAMAGVFWDWAGSRRSVLGREGAAGLEAGTMVGQAAVSAGLADRISSWDELVSQLAGMNLEPAILSAMASPEDDKDKDEKKEDALRASLVTASTSEDPKKAARAKAALKAYDEDKDEEASAARAESDDKKENEALRASVTALTASINEMRAEKDRENAAKALTAEAEAKAAVAKERSEFFASRPDLTEAQLKAFESLSLDTVKSIVSTLPAPSPLSKFVTTTTRAAVQGDRAQLPDMSHPEVTSSLDAQMGITQGPPARGVVDLGSIQRFGVTKVN
jgi:ClpP class serine protease